MDSSSSLRKGKGPRRSMFREVGLDDEDIDRDIDPFDMSKQRHSVAADTGLHAVCGTTDLGRLGTAGQQALPGPGASSSPSLGPTSAATPDDEQRRPVTSWSLLVRGKTRRKGDSQMTTRPSSSISSPEKTLTRTSGGGASSQQRPATPETASRTQQQQPWYRRLLGRARPRIRTAAAAASVDPSTSLAGGTTSTGPATSSVSGLARATLIALLIAIFLPAFSYVRFVGTSIGGSAGEHHGQHLTTTHWNDGDDGSFRQRRILVPSSPGASAISLPEPGSAAAPAAHPVPAPPVADKGDLDPHHGTQARRVRGTPLQNGAEQDDSRRTGPRVAEKEQITAPSVDRLETGANSPT